MIMHVTTGLPPGAALDAGGFDPYRFDRYVGALEFSIIFRHTLDRTGWEQGDARYIEDRLEPTLIVMYR